MDEISKQKLDALFDDANKRVKQAEVKRDLEAEAQAAFLSAFIEKRDGEVTAALEEFAEYIAPHGWNAILSKSDDAAARDDLRGQRSQAAQAAMIQLQFHQGEAATRYGDSYPRFAIICDKRNRSVTFHESTMGPGHGGSAGASGSVKLEDLTVESVQARLVKYFEKLLNDARPWDQR